jgi:hypothetical protein
VLDSLQTKGVTLQLLWQNTKMFTQMDIKALNFLQFTGNGERLVT